MLWVIVLLGLAISVAITIGVLFAVGVLGGSSASITPSSSSSSVTPRASTTVPGVVRPIVTPATAISNYPYLAVLANNTEFSTYTTSSFGSGATALFSTTLGTGALDFVVAPNGLFGILCGASSVTFVDLSNPSSPVLGTAFTIASSLGVITITPDSAYLFSAVSTSNVRSYQILTGSRTFSQVGTILLSGTSPSVSNITSSADGNACYVIGRVSGTTTTIWSLSGMKTGTITQATSTPIPSLQSPLSNAAGAVLSTDGTTLYALDNGSPKGIAILSVSAGQSAVYLQNSNFNPNTLQLAQIFQAIDGKTSWIIGQGLTGGLTSIQTTGTNITQDSVITNLSGSWFTTALYVSRDQKTLITGDGNGGGLVLINGVTRTASDPILTSIQSVQSVRGFGPLS